MEPRGDIRVLNLSSLLTSGKFSDVKLICESREFAVHKAILCAQSRVISAECEGNFEESKSNVIKIEEFSADTVERMLEFLYSGDYSVSQSTDSSSRNVDRTDEATSEETEHETVFLNFSQFPGNALAVTKKDVLCWHLNANAIGDYYDIKPLCMLARSKMQSAVETDWSPDDFLHLLTEVCTARKTGDIEFHRLLGQIISKHLEDLTGLQDLDALDMPADIATSVVVSSAERVRSLEMKVRDQVNTIDSLEQSKNSLEMQVSNAHRVHETLSSYSACRNSTCNETFPCYNEQDGTTYNLRCSRCRCRH